MTANDRIERERLLRGAVLAGDEGAWRSWCDQSFDAIDAYVLWRCGGRRDWADELVQETWLTAVRQVRKFDPRRASFSTWLHGIAANLLRNHFRRRAAESRAEPLDEDPAACSAGPSEAEEQAERVAAALAALPERYEAVLKAKYLDGGSVAEIAAAWNETPKTIESLLTRARAAFRDRYRDPHAIPETDAV